MELLPIQAAVVALEAATETQVAHQDQTELKTDPVADVSEEEGADRIPLSQSLVGLWGFRHESALVDERVHQIDHSINQQSHQS